jgi:hypothetical protein
MASIERTAYPRYFKRTKIKASELAFSYALTRDELLFINKTANTDTSRLNIAILLKTFQKLRYFIEFTGIPKEVIKYNKNFRPFKLSSMQSMRSITLKLPRPIGTGRKFVYQHTTQRVGELNPILIKLSMGYRYNLGYGYNSTTTLYSHRQKTREYLKAVID